MTNPGAGPPRVRSRTWVLSLPLTVDFPPPSIPPSSICLPSLSLVLVAHRVAQPQAGDLLDLAERRFDLRLGAVPQACLQGAEDTPAVVQTGTDHEREAEALAVGGVEPLQLGPLLGAHLVQAGA